jgi:tetratricopeptide (TPR) repeat protein
MKKLAITLWFVTTTLFCAAAEDTGKPSAALEFKKTQQILSNADQARDTANYVDAFKYYRDALNAYIRLSKAYPDWQPGVTQFRIAYCSNQIEAVLKKIDDKTLSQLIPGPATTADPAEPLITSRIEETPATKTRPDTARIEAKLLLEKGETAKAREVVMEALKASPDDRNLRLIMGTIHCRANEFDNCAYLMESLVQEDQSNAYARVILGTAYFGLGKIPDAMREMRQALVINPKLSEAHYNLVQLYLASAPADTNAARAHYKTALQLGAKRDKNLDFLLVEPASTRPGQK